MKNLYLYLRNLQTGKITLWHHLICYFVIVYFYVDPKISLWITAASISIVIGMCLKLSTLCTGGVALPGIVRKSIAGAA